MNETKTDIQRARDVLAKWRDEATVQPWDIGYMLGDPHWVFVISDGIGCVINSRKDDDTLVVEDARLIVGTAGNPDLLNVNRDVLTYGLLHIDLRDAGEPYFPVVIDIAQRIAAAIIDADDRMTSRPQQETT